MGSAARVRGGDVDIAVTGADTNPRVGVTMFGANSIQHVRDGEVIALGIAALRIAQLPGSAWRLRRDTGAGLA